MKDYISVQDLLKQATEQKLDLGKGNPYNRLRYYTKMGWLPHMTRKKGEVGATKGHYPVNTLERLSLIQKFKDMGLSNDDITTKLHMKDKVSSFYSILSVTEIKKRISTYVVIVLLTFIVLAELGYVKIGKTKEDLVIFTEPKTQTLNILASGEGIIRANTKSVDIKTSDITQDTKIYVTFKGDYAPANRFWVATQIIGEGFTIELDKEVLNDTSFNWWVSK